MASIMKFLTQLWVVGVFYFFGCCFSYTSNKKKHITIHFQGKSKTRENTCSFGICGFN